MQGEASILQVDSKRDYRRPCPVLRRVHLISHNCRTVFFLVLLDHFLDLSADGLGLGELYELARENGLEFPSMQAFKMYISRLVAAGVLKRTRDQKYVLGLSRTETRILYLLRDLCLEAGGGTGWETEWTG